MSDPLTGVHSHRVKNFDELDSHLGGTGGVSFLDKRYLGVEDEKVIAQVKAYTKQVLREVLEKRGNPVGVADWLLNWIGYRDALIAKYGILMVAARRRLDKENPGSLISALEEKLSQQVKALMKALDLPEGGYWPWMTVFSYPSRGGGECHPWIVRFQEALGSGAVEAAKRVRSIINVYRAAALRWIEQRLGRDLVDGLRGLVERLQRIHFWSEKDELEEAEDLELTNMVVDNFCPHWQHHPNLAEIRGCPDVKRILEPSGPRRLRLALYILADDYFGRGRELRRMTRQKLQKAMTQPKVASATP